MPEDELLLKDGKRIALIGLSEGRFRVTEAMEAMAFVRQMPVIAIEIVKHGRP